LEDHHPSSTFNDISMNPPISMLVDAACLLIQIRFKMNLWFQFHKNKINRVIVAATVAREKKKSFLKFQLDLEIVSWALS